MLRFSLVPHVLSGLRIDGACPLCLPVQRFSRIRHPVVHFSRAADSLCDIGRMRSYFGSYNSLFYIFHVWQRQMFRRSYIT